MEARVSEILAAPSEAIGSGSGTGPQIPIEAWRPLCSNQTMSNFAQSFPKTNSVLPNHNHSTIELVKCRPAYRQPLPLAGILASLELQGPRP